MTAMKLFVKIAVKLTDDFPVLMLLYRKKDAPDDRKAVPKYCVSHENKKLILFCIEHDKLICHACLSESHRQCNSIVEIEKAAAGIKDSAAIKQLKEKMTKLKSILQKTQIENEQQLTTINIDTLTTLKNSCKVLKIT